MAKKTTTETPTAPAPDPSIVVPIQTPVPTAPQETVPSEDDLVPAR